MWQHVHLSEQIRPWDTLACCWDVKQQTNKQTGSVQTYLYGFLAAGFSNQSCDRWCAHGVVSNCVTVAVVLIYWYLYKWYTVVWTMVHSTPSLVDLLQQDNPIKAVTGGVHWVLWYCVAVTVLLIYWDLYNWYTSICTMVHSTSDVVDLLQQVSPKLWQVAETEHCITYAIFLVFRYL